MNSLLERFGFQYTKYRPEMPLGRLQGDRFWKIQNTEHVQISSSINDSNLRTFQESRSIFQKMKRAILKIKFLSGINKKFSGHNKF
ncbi:hypothetical protein HMPREF0880_00386 [Yokenella regensburgei ATCC 43003]|nr:hypothetical protein HMPREF0880_00386 [Yokenella regensburgei ATCC 43003]